MTSARKGVRNGNDLTWGEYPVSIPATGDPIPARISGQIRGTALDPARLANHFGRYTMKVSRNVTFTAVSAIALAIGLVPALAQQTQGHHDGKPDTAMGMMGDQDGMMGMMAMMMGGAMREAMAGFDSNGDGTTSPEEMTAGVETALKTYDTDASGSLSLDEFAAFHAAMMRPMTVRMFQMHDSDGDAAVTKAEMAAMAAMMQGRMAGSQDGMSGMGTGMMDGN
jgi:hypothetical protein